MDELSKNKSKIKMKTEPTQVNIKRKLERKKIQLLFFHVWRPTAVRVDWLTFTPGFSLLSCHIGFLAFCFCQQSNFASAYNFIYISTNSLSNKRHSSRQLQGRVLERGLAIYATPVCAYLCVVCVCALCVCVVNSRKVCTHTHTHLT